MTGLTLPSDGQPNDDFVTIPDVPIVPDSSRVTPQQVATGVTRGTQTIVGSDSSQVTFGVVPSTTRLGLAQYDKTNKLVSELGQQADGSNSLKFFDSSGIGIAQFGTFPDGTTGLKVAKSGVEVSAATNDQLIFNSNQDVFKIVKTGTASITPPSSWGGGNAQTVTIVHSLSSSPAFLVYVNNPVGIPGTVYAGQLSSVPSVIWGPSASGGVGFYLSSARVDGTNLYIDLVNLLSSTQTGVNAYTWNYKYYILQETAT